MSQHSNYGFPLGSHYIDWTIQVPKISYAFIISMYWITISLHILSFYVTISYGEYIKKKPYFTFTRFQLQYLFTPKQISILLLNLYMERSFAGRSYKIIYYLFCEFCCEKLLH